MSVLVLGERSRSNLLKIIPSLHFIVEAQMITMTQTQTVFES